MKRIKKWLTILPVTVVTAILTLSPGTVMAQGEDGTMDNPDYPYTGSLAIVAPRIARENQQISMTVFNRWDQEPMEGAGVWAFTREKADIVREEMKVLANNDNIVADAKDYEAVASVHGTFIGTTGADGKLYYTFEEKGGYLLMAVKKTYFPGFTSIRIGTIPRVLVLEAPKKAAVDETVLMKVTQRNTGDAVEGAGVWALTRENAESLQAELKSIRENPEITAANIDYESIIGIYGELLGRTDELGQLNYAFSEEGGYLLVAVKSGYIPARAGIRIGDPVPKALLMQAPNRAMVDEEVTMTVEQRGTHEPIRDAGIWAITRDRMESLQTDMAALRQNAVADAENKDYESLMGLYGEFLGRTNELGRLSHAFSEEGGYLLVAVKSGYFPGWSPIRIVSESDTVTPRKDNQWRLHGENTTSMKPIIKEAPVTDADTV